MTTKAGIRLEEERLVDRLLEQRVEMRSKFGILRSHFDESTAHRIHDDRIVEVNDAWILRPDQRRLQACLREDDRLRFDRNLQGIQERRQIPLILFKAEMDLAGIDVRRQLRNGIVSGPDSVTYRGISNGWHEGTIAQ